jgi:hypothetical protein
MEPPFEVQGREEHLREIEEQERSKGDRRFRNAEEALKAFRDLFESDEEMDEFMAEIRRVREDARARYRD